MIRHVLTVVLGLVLSQGTAHAQQKTEPASVTVALTGTVVVAAGYGMMLHQPVSGESDVKWMVGGTVMVAAGVTMVYLGLRQRTVIIAPSIGPHRVGAVGAIQWGRRGPK